MMASILLAALLCVGLLTDAVAQTPQPAIAQTATGVSELQRITAEYDECRKEHQQNKRLFDGISAQDELLARKQIGQEMLLAVMALQAECRQLRDKNDAEKMRHIELKEKVDSYLSKAGVMPQELSALTHILSELKGMGQALERREKTLDGCLKECGRLLLTVPPPDEFMILNRFRFVKITIAKRPPFYVLDGPVNMAQWNAIAKKSGTIAPVNDQGHPFHPRTKLTHDDAKAFAAAMSRVVDEMVFLPTARQAEALEKLKPEGFGSTLKVALWLDGRWLRDHRSGSIDQMERDALIRYGVTMYSVWDPSGRLHRKNSAESALVGEFPYANYPDLGMTLAASVQLGRKQQLRQAAAQLRAVK